HAAAAASARRPDGPGPSSTACCRSAPSGRGSPAVPDVWSGSRPPGAAVARPCARPRSAPCRRPARRARRRAPSGPPPGGAAARADEVAPGHVPPAGTGRDWVAGGGPAADTRRRPARRLPAPAERAGRRTSRPYGLPPAIILASVGADGRETAFVYLNGMQHFGQLSCPTCPFRDLALQRRRDRPPP